ncbi:hypothetical protein CCP2SC5_40046 [Azospirillaceae bacterium]
MEKVVEKLLNLLSMVVRNLKLGFLVEFLRTDLVLQCFRLPRIPSVESRLVEKNCEKIVKPVVNGCKQPEIGFFDSIFEN